MLLIAIVLCRNFLSTIRMVQVQLYCTMILVLFIEASPASSPILDTGHVLLLLLLLLLLLMLLLLLLVLVLVNAITYHDYGSDSNAV